MMQEQKPAIILISPQLGENIGSAARAMQNFGLDDLRLVNPRDGWPNRDAVDVARNAIKILESAKIYSDLESAVADVNVLYATTARPRDMVKSVITPNKCANKIIATGNSAKSAIMFGPERTGMNNSDIILADYIVTIPTNNENASLNLAQAVLVLCYEWFNCYAEKTEEILSIGDSLPATKSELSMMLKHLETELCRNGFFSSTEMHPVMLRNLNNIFTRNNLTSQEVKTLRGVINYLVGNRIKVEEQLRRID